MTDIDTGLNVWQMTSNHNRMIELQGDTSPPRDGPVELAYYGSSAFKITAPRDVSVMIDSRVGAERIAGPRKIYQIAELDKLERAVHFFGDQVDSDKDSWREGRD